MCRDLWDSCEERGVGVLGELCFVTWFLFHYGKQARFRPYTVTRPGDKSRGLCKLCWVILSWRSLAVEETGQREAGLDREGPPYIKIQGTI